MPERCLGLGHQVCYSGGKALCIFRLVAKLCWELNRLLSPDGE